MDSKTIKKSNNYPYQLVWNIKYDNCKSYHQSIDDAIISALSFYHELQLGIRKTWEFSRTGRPKVTREQIKEWDNMIDTCKCTIYCLNKKGEYEKSVRGSFGLYTAFEASNSILPNFGWKHFCKLPFARSETTVNLLEEILLKYKMTFEHCIINLEKIKEKQPISDTYAENFKKDFKELCKDTGYTVDDFLM